jgi:hypothetical protein
MADLFFAEPNSRSFVLFNAQPLSDEPVTDSDMAPVEAHGEEMNVARAAAWSSGVWWYFVILEAGILLMSVATHHGVICKKKSWKFIEGYLDYRK